MTWHVFISHASEDKESVARPLATALKSMGMKVWLDDFELTIGDSLRRSIDRGLSSSQFGVIILSKSFFSKEWPNRELDGLAAREDGNEKVILPVWHEVSHEDVRAFSPTLADRLAVSTKQGIEVVAKRVFEAANRQSLLANLPAADSPANNEKPLSSIRRRLLLATDSHEMRLLLSEVEAYLSRSPFDPEARELKRTVEAAMHPSRPRAAPAPVHGRRFAPAIVAFSLATLVTSVVLWQYVPMNRPDQSKVSPPLSAPSSATATSQPPTPIPASEPSSSPASAALAKPPTTTVPKSESETKPSRQSVSLRLAVVIMWDQGEGATPGFRVPSLFSCGAWISLPPGRGDPTYPRKVKECTAKVTSSGVGEITLDARAGQVFVERVVLGIQDQPPQLFSAYRLNQKSPVRAPINWLERGQIATVPIRWDLR